MNSETDLLLSTAYLPPVEYMALLVTQTSINIEAHETFLKQSYRNRCNIMTANGCLSLTIPVNKPNGNKTKTKDIQIQNSEEWFTNHWRAIVSAYSGSPFFLYYKDDFEDFYSGRYNNLLEYNTLLITKVLYILNTVAEINLTDSFNSPQGLKHDYRYSISPKKSYLIEEFEEYVQVFSNKFKFVPNLSILDLLFNLGPETKEYLLGAADKIVRKSNYS